MVACSVLELPEKPNGLLDIVPKPRAARARRHEAWMIPTVSHFRASRSVIPPRWHHLFSEILNVLLTARHEPRAAAYAGQMDQARTRASSSLEQYSHGREWAILPDSLARHPPSVTNICLIEGLGGSSDTASGGLSDRRYLGIGFRRGRYWIWMMCGRTRRLRALLRMSDLRVTCRIGNQSVIAAFFRVA